MVCNKNGMKMDSLNINYFIFMAQKPETVKVGTKMEIYNTKIIFKMVLKMDFKSNIMIINRYSLNTIMIMDKYMVKLKDGIQMVKCNSKKIIKTD